MQEYERGIRENINDKTSLNYILTDVQKTDRLSEEERNKLKLQLDSAIVDYDNRHPGSAPTFQQQQQIQEENARKAMLPHNAEEFTKMHQEADAKEAQALRLKTEQQKLEAQRQYALSSQARIAEDLAKKQKEKDDLEAKISSYDALGKRLLARYREDIDSLGIPAEELKEPIVLNGGREMAAMLGLAGFTPKRGDIFAIEGLNRPSLELLIAYLYNAEGVEKLGPFKINDDNTNYYGFQMKSTGERVQNFVFTDEMGELFLSYYGQGNTVRSISENNRSKADALLERFIDKQKSE